MNANAWRSIVAALADDTARDVYARIVLRQPLDDALSGMPPAKARRVVQALEGAGLIVSTSAGYDAVPGVFAAALSAAPRAERSQGVERFLVDGRISSYPSRAADRRALLEHVVARLMSRDETLSEAEVNARLAAVTDDVAALRRYLVDADLLTRAASGHSYRRTTEPSA